MLTANEARTHSLDRTMPLWSGETLMAPPVSLALGGLTLTTTFTLSAHQSIWDCETHPSLPGKHAIAGVVPGNLPLQAEPHLRSVRAGLLPQNSDEVSGYCFSMVSACEGTKPAPQGQCCDLVFC